MRYIFLVLAFVFLTTLFISPAKADSTQVQCLVYQGNIEGYTVYGYYGGAVRFQHPVTVMVSNGSLGGTRRNQVEFFIRSRDFQLGLEPTLNGSLWFASAPYFGILEGKALGYQNTMELAVVTQYQNGVYVAQVDPRINGTFLTGPDNPNRFGTEGEKNDLLGGLLLGGIAPWYLNGVSWNVLATGYNIMTQGYSAFAFNQNGSEVYGRVEFRGEPWVSGGSGKAYYYGEFVGNFVQQGRCADILGAFVPGLPFSGAELTSNTQAPDIALPESFEVRKEKLKQSQTTTNAEVTQASTGSVYGYITNSSYQFVPSVQVWAYSEDWIYGTCTDAYGYYQINDMIVDDDYIVIAGGNDNQYWCGVQNGYPWHYYPGTRDLDEALLITLTSNAPTQVANMSVAAGGVVAGYLYNNDASDILTDGVVLGVDPVTVNWDFDLSDTAGYYEITLPAGDYYMSANAPGRFIEYYQNTDDIENATKVNVAAGYITSPVNFTLDTYGTISGTVRDSNGNPLPNMLVTAMDKDLETGSTACTDANGQYTIAELKKNTSYWVEAGGLNWCEGSNNYPSYLYPNTRDINQATLVSLENGIVQQTGIDFALTVGGSISGQVLIEQDGTTPIYTGLLVALEQTTGDYFLGRTNPDGTYTLVLPQGTYRVFVMAADFVTKFLGDTTNYDLSSVATVNANTTLTGQNFLLEAGALISGKVTDSSGAPLPNVAVFVSGDWSSGTCTDENGQYTIGYAPLNTPLTVSAGGVEASCPQSQNYVPKNYPSPLQLTTTGATNINLVLQPNTAPSINSPGNQSHTQGDSISLPISATDGEPLTFAAENLPPGLTINAETGLISGVISNSANGSYTVTITAEDTGGLAGQVTFTWVINAGNLPTATPTNTAQPPTTDLNLIAPSGTVNSIGNPVFEWSVINGATSYQLYVAPTDNLFFPVFYNDNLAAATYCTATSCSLRLTDLEAFAWLVDGDYTVFIKPDNTDWGGPFEFSVNAPAPAAPVLGEVTGITTTTRPTINWTHDGNAAYFHIYLAPAADLFNPLTAIDTWLARDEVCGSWEGTTCSWQVSEALQNATAYHIYMQSWGAGGYSTGGGIPGVDGWNFLIFNVGGLAPAEPQASEFSYAVSGGQVTMTFPDDPVVTDYTFAFVLPDGTFVILEVAKSALTCNGTTCTYTPDFTLQTGEHEVYVQPVGAGGPRGDGLLNLGWFAVGSFNN